MLRKAAVIIPLALVVVTALAYAVMFAITGDPQIGLIVASSQFRQPVTGPAPAPPVDVASLELENPLLFVTQTPVDHNFGTIADIFGNFRGYYPPESQPVGGNLWRLDPDGSLTNLTNRSDVAVRDPEISYDGQRVLFSMKVGGEGNWQLYEMDVAGSEPNLVSPDRTVNDWDPAYLPDGRIVFITDRLGLADGYENLPEGQMFVMAADGSEVEAINVNPSGSFNPLVGSNGMIYFTQWDFHDFRARFRSEPLGELATNRFLVWEIFPDGSREGHPIYGSHTIYDFSGGYTEVREIPDGSGDMLATLAPEFYAFGTGSIVRIAPRDPTVPQVPDYLTTDVFDALAENEAGRFRSAYPLADGRIVASYAAGSVFDYGLGLLDTPTLGLILMDGDGANLRWLYQPPDSLWAWQPVEVAARPLPPILDGVGVPGYDYAVLNAHDVYLRGITEDDTVLNGDYQRQPEPDEVAAIRFYQLKRLPNGQGGDFAGYDDPRQEWLGDVPVADDGSMAAVVPPRVPLIWEAIDAEGNVLVHERFWSELAPGEVRECSGCHAPHDGSVGRTSNRALQAPTNLTDFDVDTDGDGVIDLLAEDYVTGLEAVSSGS